MNISKCIGEKIGILMEKNNISFRTLSEQIGVTHPTLKKYVDGAQPIDSEKLMKVARYFSVPFDYFFKDNSSSMYFLFRADRPAEKIKNNDVFNFRTTLEEYVDIVDDNMYSYVPSKYSLNANISSKVSDENKSAIEKIAVEQRRLMKIDNIIPENYFESIESIGINLIVKDYKNDEFYGASSYSDSYGSFILINDSPSIPEERKIFSLFHEYAHLLFNRNQYVEDEKEAFYQSDRSDINEKIANKFAGCFLLPRNLVNDYIKQNSGKIDLFDMKRYFKVSLKCLCYVLKDYQIISENECSSFYRIINAGGHVKEEPEPIKGHTIEEKNGRLINKMKSLYFDDNITANKVSEILNLSTIDTRQLMKKWEQADERYIHLR